MTRTKNTAPVYLIYGDDDYLVSTQARALVRQLLPDDPQGLSLDVVEGEVKTLVDAHSRARQTRECLQTGGFFAERKVVWLRQANFLDAGKLGKSKELRENLKLLASLILSGLPDEQTLVISATAADAKSDLYKACEAKGRVMELMMPPPWKREKPAIQFVLTALQTAGILASDDIVERIIKRAGTDLRLLDQEMIKLFTFLDDRKTITADDVASVISPAREVATWDLETAIGERSLPQALTLLRQMLFQKAEPLMIIMMLEHFFRNALIIKEALDQRWLLPPTGGNDFSGLRRGAMPDGVENQLEEALSGEKGKMRPMVETKLGRVAARFSRAELERNRDLILDTRWKLVSSDLAPLLLLDLLIVQLCRRLPPAPTLRSRAG